MQDEFLYGADMFGASAAPAPGGKVAERFGFPPFTVLDAKLGAWRERRRAWLSLGIRSELGRGEMLAYKHTFKGYEGVPEDVAGTSVFDPVLCELMYRWFCPPGGQVVDPFAGGSVRGVVATIMGLQYWGCDLRAEQIAANEQQALAIGVRPTWCCGDSMDTLPAAPAADFIMSCPPYGDLERYSDDAADLSAMEWHTFRAAYRRIILRALERLKDDRFACFVVADFRDPRGFYRNFVGDTVAAFEEFGVRLYNEAVLATPIGTGRLRVTNQFNGGRKMVKTHQNVLVFCKGNPRKAATLCTESAD